MDELVTDLTLALERTDDPQSSTSDATIGTKDSPSATPVRKNAKKRRGRKRRSDFPLTKDLALPSEESDDSIDEALKDYIENITMNQSDSDEDSALSNSKRLSMLHNHRFQMTELYPLPERPESDSVTETSIKLNKRRQKRNNKLKRTSQQTNLPGQFQSAPDLLNNPHIHHGKVCHGHHKRSLKRKHSCKISGDSLMHRAACDADSTIQDGDPGRIHVGATSTTVEPMDVGSMPGRHRKHFKFLGSSSEHGYEHSSDACTAWLDGIPNDHLMANTGSESETSSDFESEGFFTNDEGRLADDEQEESSFEHDVVINPWWEQEDSQRIDDDKKFNKILNGVMEEYGVPEATQQRGAGFKARLNSLKSMYSQESIRPLLVGTNNKISKFIQDSSKTELNIPLTTRKEREQIYKLASLYALHCRTESTTRGRVVLIKTKNTCRPDKHALDHFLGKNWDNRKKVRQSSETKRARKMLLPKEGVVGQSSSPIPRDNIGNQMLRDMGWTPGQGLGPSQTGIVDPIKATLRPRGLGLGHAWPS